MKEFNEKIGAKVKINKDLVGEWGFHGDVICHVEELPEDFDSWPLIADGVVALGEATGHMHKFFGDDYEVRENPKTKERHLKIVKPVALKHQEHNLVEVESPSKSIGFRIGIVREYDHMERTIRRVVD